MIARGVAITSGARGSPLPPIDSRSVGKIVRVLRRHAGQWDTPVVSVIAKKRRDPFLTLVSCVLSLRTKDDVTAAASKRLFERAQSPGEILRLPARTLERLIYPVGFYHTKARAIRAICRDLIENFSGSVPSQIAELLKLKGVGRKTANLVVTEGFGKPGICVDTHVHRISNRWGLVKTSTPEQTEMRLRQVLPRRYWIEYNGLLVAFGQTICQPVSPWCSRCPLRAVCPRINVTRSR